VRRALLAALVLVLAGWAVVARFSGGDQPSGQSPAQPPAALPTYPAPTAPPPWGTDPRDEGQSFTVTSIYSPTPLDGHWASRPLSAAQARAIPGTRPHERLTLQFRSTALAVWAGPAAHRRLLGYEAVYVEPHRVQLSPVGVDGKAVYRWSLDRGRLTFRLLHRTGRPSASARLVTVPFVRSS
jgi:hypothetical protein